MITMMAVKSLVLISVPSMHLDLLLMVIPASMHMQTSIKSNDRKLPKVSKTVSLLSALTGCACNKQLSVTRNKV